MTRHINFGRGITILAVLLAGLVAALLTVVSGPGQSANAAVGEGKVGPIVPETGFPFYFGDSNTVRLELCLDGPPMCLASLPNPDQPAVVAADPADSNFPDESFWWTGEAQMPTNGGGQAILVLARESAFSGAEAVQDDFQSGFSRVRIRVDNLRIGATYTVTHPYGVDTFTAENDGKGNGEINFTEDVGCFGAPRTPCKFRAALFGRIDPFLTWDGTAPAPPEGYVGNPNVEHRVTGSPVVDASNQPQNYFKIEGPNVGGPGKNVIKTNLFSVQGKLAGRAPSTLTLKASSSTIKLGKGTQLSGKLSSFRRKLDGSRIVITKKPAGATKFSKLTGGTLTTKADGTFLLRGVKPRKNTLYKVSFGGEAPTVNTTGYLSSRDGVLVRVIR